MNRREAIIAGMAGLTAAVAITPTEEAQAAEGDKSELEQIRALLRAHDEAFTNHDLKGVMACLTEKAAIMGTGLMQVKVLWGPCDQHSLTGAAEWQVGAPMPCDPKLRNACAPPDEHWRGLSIDAMRSPE